MLGRWIASLLCFDWADVFFGRFRIWLLLAVFSFLFFQKTKKNLEVILFFLFLRCVFSVVAWLFFLRVCLQFLCVMIWTWSSCGWYKNSVLFHFILQRRKEQLSGIELVGVQKKTKQPQISKTQQEWRNKRDHVGDGVKNFTSCRVMYDSKQTCFTCSCREPSTLFLRPPISLPTDSWVQK